MIKCLWFKMYDNLPLEKPLRIIQSWDTASKAGLNNDFSVCTTWYQYRHGYYLIDVLRKKLEFPDLKKQIIRSAESYHNPVILIEETSSGIGLIQSLQRETTFSIIPITPKYDKISRMYQHTATIEAGNVFLKTAAGWLEELELEIARFPRGRHDDQVDSMSQALDYMTQNPLKKYVVSYLESESEEFWRKKCGFY